MEFCMVFSTAWMCIVDFFFYVWILWRLSGMPCSFVVVSGWSVVDVCKRRFSTSYQNEMLSGPISQLARTGIVYLFSRFLNRMIFSGSSFLYMFPGSQRPLLFRSM